MASSLVTITALVCLFGLGTATYPGVQGPVADCDPIAPVWRNNNRTCPERAVCADVFDTVRNWYGYQDRQPCREHRILHNCLCEGESGAQYACPVNNNAHRIFSTRSHKQFTCRPACTLPYCNNLSSSRGPNTAVTFVQQDPMFGGRNYYKMECRCPRHHQPVQSRQVQRAVFPYSSRYNYQTHQYMTLYKCRNVGTERFLTDPCEN